MSNAVRIRALALVALLVAAADVAAEPMFLSRQYTRCTTCHHSPTGGGLLTAYGRSLSHRELSTFNAPMSSHEPDAPPGGEESFLWGALGDRTGPLERGVDLRPSHLTFSFDGARVHRNFWMTADLLAAVRLEGWTLYGQVGRRATPTGGELDSYEYWISYGRDSGLGVRAGRFLPAYGVRFADHTAFNRQVVGLGQFDQIYGVEVSRSSERTLLQVAAGPGQADALLDDDRDGAFTAAARLQVDLAPRNVLVASGLYRDDTGLEPRRGMAGVALGLSPGRRTTIWTQLDAEGRAGAGELRLILVNETSFEVNRGIWLKVSPQLRVGGGPLVPDVARFSAGAVLLPRTHWNVNLSFYHDRNRTLSLTTRTFLAQLHLYL